MGQSIVQVDSFTREAFTGNPAAVCLMDGPADELWMQRVAREMNLSETAFLYPADDGFRLRWFTPTVEMELCGHATLASAHVLWEDATLEPDQPAKFYTRSGLLTAVKRGDLIEMNFPATPAPESPVPPGLLEALGVEAVFVGRNKYDVLVEVASEAMVRACRPDFSAIKRLDVRGIGLTGKSETAAFDFVSRFFAPAAGIDEDPVTGALHCILGPHWAARLNKTEMVGFQASERGGVVRVRTEGDRVALGGAAVTVLRAELL